MKRLLELAEQIKDKALREKTVAFLKTQSLGNKNFKYRAIKLDKAPAADQWHHTQKGGLVLHTEVVAKACLSVAEVLEKTYNITINKDALLAAALLHDICKIFEYRGSKSGWKHTGIMLDHTMLAVSELYTREFPEDVIHIVAAHFGEAGPTPPRNIEAFILHHIDNMDAHIGSILFGSSQDLVIYNIAEEVLKKSLV